MKPFQVLSPIALLLICTVAAFAALPQTISYQGYIKDANTGAPLNSNAVSMKFSLYSSTRQGSGAVWSETQSVSVNNGIYNVQLGASSPNQAISAQFDVPYWLGVNVAGSGEFPLHPLSSTGFAFRAGVAESVSSSGNATITADGQTALRIEPNATSPNIALGNPANGAGGVGVYGASVSGGGSAANNCYDFVKQTYTKPCGNKASNNYSTVGGGINNTASGNISTVSGGNSNYASGENSSVGGGEYNSATGATSSVVGGGFNSAGGAGSTIGGGSSNIASQYYATVSGGYNNKATNYYSTVGGGANNISNNFYSTIGGGLSNSANGENSTVCGGTNNSAGGDFSFTAGQRAKVRDKNISGADPVFGDKGTFVWADSQNADFVSTGQNQFLVRATGGVGINTNTPSSALEVNGTVKATQFSGDGTGLTGLWKTTGNAGTVAGVNFIGTTDNIPVEIRANNKTALRLEPASYNVGLVNVVSPNIIAGISENSVINSAYGATIAGGGGYKLGPTATIQAMPNSVTAPYGTISGGSENSASHYAVVSGGQQNTANSKYSIVSGGQQNTASGYSSTVIGGALNTASGGYATVSGGSGNTAGGNYSWVGGNQAIVRDAATVGPENTFGDQGTFVWADVQGTPFTSTGQNQFLIRAQNGVGINTNAPTTALDVNGTVSATVYRVPGAGVNSGTSAFIHKVTTGNICTGNPAGTVIDNPVINNNPNAILLVTMNSGSIKTNTIENNGPVFAVSYDDFDTNNAPGWCGHGVGKWVIYSINAGTAPPALKDGAMFNVMAILP